MIASPYFQEVLRKIAPLDRSLERAAQQRLDGLTKPPGSLGRIERLARRVALIQGHVPPRTGRKLLFVFAADHGVADEAVSAFPKTVTAQMTRNMVAGGAAINVLARHCGVETEIIDVGVDHDFAGLRGLRHCKVRPGTANFTVGPAMRRDEAVRAVELGVGLAREAAATQTFLLGAGEIGIGNTTSATAVFCALNGAEPARVAGRGTGIDDLTLRRKIGALETALRLNRPDPRDPLDVLAKVGGLEIGAITGLILGAAALRIPMVLDGFVCGAAALLAQRWRSAARDVLFASHLSAEQGHRSMLEQMRLKPILDLQLRLGEGTGACLAMGLIEAAVRIMAEMATFESAGVEVKAR